MSVTAYSVVTAKAPSALNSAVAQAIADGKQPLGSPFTSILPNGEAGYHQAMVTGAIITGAGGNDYTTAWDTDATMAANSDVALPTQKAVKTALATKPTAALDTDATLAANSDAKVASQKAVKTALALKAPLAAPVFTSPANVLATGAAHTVDDVITLLQALGLCKQA